MKGKRLLLLTVLLFLLGAILLLFPDAAGLLRQKREEKLAKVYLSEKTETESGSGNETEEENTVRTAVSEEGLSGPDETAETASAEENSAETYAPEAFTPEYGRGFLQCVLTVPSEKIGICRGVYSGTREDIAYDLNLWMVTAARPDYVLGETHFVIYGHNHPIRDLSFNRLQKLLPGDVFTLTADEKVYTYQVARVFGLSRERVASEIADNFALSKDYCYLVTCGRRDYRYLDFVAEGVLLTVEDR